MSPRVRSALADAVRRLSRRTPYAVVWRNPRGWSLPTHLAAVFEELRVNCVLDVGAHHGEYALSLRREGYRGRIVSFEPVRESVEVLRARAAGDPEWRVRAHALGSEPGIAELNVAAKTDMSSFLAASPAVSAKLAAATAVAQREAVEVARLDDVLDECVDGLAEPRVFLKLDTQGWDLEVVAGARRALEHVVGLQSELSVKPVYEGMPSYLDALASLAGLGFELSGLYPVTYDGLAVVELDAVLIRPSPGTPRS